MRTFRFTILSGVTALAFPLAVSAQRVSLAGPRPLADIAATSSDGIPLFARAIGAARFTDGTIAIADAGSAAVKLVDARGRLIKTVGRRGNGPGEFQMMGWMGRCGTDSVLVHDFIGQRLTLLDRSGAILSQTTAQTNPAVITCTDGGHLAVLRRPTHMPAAGSAQGWVSGMLTLASLHDAIVRDVGEIHAFQYSMPSGLMTPRPLGSVTSLALTQKVLYVGTADSSAIDVLSLDGKYMRTIRLLVAPRSPTPAHIDAAATALASYQPDATDRAALKRKLMAVPMPALLPAYSALRADPFGNLWAVVSVPGDSTTHLRAFNDAGVEVADFTIPRPLLIYEVGLDYLLAGFEDENGEQHIHVYGLARR